MFSLRHSKEERQDLDWEQEENGRRARREAEERKRENNNSSTGKNVSHKDRRMGQNQSVISSFFSIIQEEENNSVIRRLIGWFCGGAASQANEPDKSEESEKLPDISEAPVWKYTVNANAVIMMAVAVFMWGYFA